MILTERETWNLVLRLTLIVLVAVALLIANPGAVFAQSVGEDQYTNSDPGQQQDEYTNPVPGQAGQNKDGQDQGRGNQQVPVAPDNPAYPGSPGSNSQTPETFEQALAGILTDLNSVSQSLATLGQNSAPVAAQDSNAALTVPTAPANVIAGGTGTVPIPVTYAPTAVAPSSSPGQPSVAMINPFSAATNAASSNIMMIGGGIGEGLTPANSEVITIGGIGEGTVPSGIPAGGPPPGFEVMSIGPPDPEKLAAAINQQSFMGGVVSGLAQPQRDYMGQQFLFDKTKDGVNENGGPAPEEADPSGEFNPTDTKDPVTGD